RNEESAKQFLEPFKSAVGYVVLLDPGIIRPLIKAPRREETVLELKEQIHLAADDPLRNDLQQEFLPPVPRAFRERRSHDLQAIREEVAAAALEPRNCPASLKFGPSLLNEGPHIA